MVEVYRNGEPTGKLFMSAENARLWVMRQTDDALYSIRERAK